MAALEAPPDRMVWVGVWQRDPEPHSVGFWQTDPQIWNLRDVFYYHKLRVRFFKKIQDWILKSERIWKWILRFFTRQINPRDVSRFAYKSFRLQVVSPTSRFAYIEVVSPTLVISTPLGPITITNQSSLNHFFLFPCSARGKNKTCLLFKTRFSHIQLSRSNKQILFNSFVQHLKVWWFCLFIYEHYFSKLSHSDRQTVF